MKCKKCGNEVKKGAEYCETCGLRLNNNEPIKIKFNHLIVLIICIVLVFFIGIIVIINNKKEKLSDKETNVSSVQTNIQDNKEYYDFIDTEYYTFKFTEDEIVNRIMQGNSYYSQGFEKTTATIPNTNIYTKVNYSEIQSINITTNPINKKVTSLKISTSGYLSQEQITSIAKNIMTNMVIWILDVKNEEDAKEGKNLLSELLDKTSYDKGLSMDNSFSNISENILNTTIEIKIVK